jgi:hypothetical protein
LQCKFVHISISHVEVGSVGAERVRSLAGRSARFYTDKTLLLPESGKGSISFVLPDWHRFNPGPPGAQGATKRQVNPLSGMAFYPTPEQGICDAKVFEEELECGSNARYHPLPPSPSNIPEEPMVDTVEDDDGIIARLKAEVAAELALDHPDSDKPLVPGDLSDDLASSDEELCWSPTFTEASTCVRAFSVPS